MESILSQDYKKYRIVVSADDLPTLKYVKQYNVDHILVEKLHPSPECSFPYNLYINKLMGMVNNGYILILDDDDYLANKRVLNLIAEKITKPDNIIISRMMWPTGQVIPSDAFWRKIPIRGQIGMPCFVFHCKWVSAIRFDPHKAADLRFFLQLYEKARVKTWLNQITVFTGNTGLHGKPIDLTF
jgi:glycosyltransferase involved in cell wall biosynthesis